MGDRNDYDELAELIHRLNTTLLIEPFSVGWARSVLPDDCESGCEWYSYKRVIHIEPEVNSAHEDTGRFVLIVDDEGNETEMKSRAQFLALCFGLGIRVVSKRANG